MPDKRAIEICLEPFPVSDNFVDRSYADHPRESQIYGLEPQEPGGIIGAAKPAADKGELTAARKTFPFPNTQD
jgi:hypothetical protein